MYKIVRASDGIIRHIRDNKSVTNLITKDISADVSLAVVDATDYSEKEATDYDRIYYILSGEMGIEADGDTVRLSPGDACFLANGTEYKMSGTFRAAVVNAPAFGS